MSDFPRLPPQYLHRTVADLAEGETAWVTDHQCVVDADGNLWVKATTLAGDAPGGTANLRLGMTARGLQVLDHTSLRDGSHPRWHRADVADVVTHLPVANLPAELQPEVLELVNPEPTVTLLEPGDTAYVVPWALWVDEDRRMWLPAGTTTTSEPGNVTTMKVRRLVDGVEVTLVDGERYSADMLPLDCGHMLPVVALAV